ncbi:HpcH/HpaI aldolase/citrate lyase family protein [Francisella sp. SYW-9]|uniref:HpcH/HpaI aldolase/citrate lyase family protein n=1 Tax=Francisella sp. SYW-9 TaxID=2610888 RepID=UPI00123DC356|nr:CoA ester lyase [Francisella sp. SYW-9]
MNMNILLTALLFTPGNRPERFEKVKQTNANGIIIDLEDAVAKPIEKDSARLNAIEYLKNKPKNKTSFKYCLRINGLDTTHGFKDVIALIEANVFPDILLLPKVESANTLYQLDSLFKDNAPLYIALIESTKGYRNIDEIAQSSKNLIGLAFGGGDLAEELEASFTWEPLLYFRSRLVAAAKNANLSALDVPYINLKAHNNNDLIEETRKVKALGYNGKLCIHPKHIDGIQEVFMPSDDEILKAKEIINIFSKSNGNACSVDGKMIDIPMVKMAQKIINLSTREE